MIDFPSSSVQPSLGHSSQPAGKSQSPTGDSGLMPRKAVEPDSFEKQPQPPASVDNGAIVPTLIGTAVLSPILGALAGEGAWHGLASDEKKTITPAPTGASGAGKGSGTKPGGGTPDENALQESKAKLSLLQEYIKEAVPAKDINSFVPMDTLSCGEINTEIETLLKQYHLQLTRKLIESSAKGGCFL